MGFDDFFINNNGKKEQLSNAKHGVRRDQVDEKFHNVFDAFDINQDGTLEDSELDIVFKGLTKYSGADKTLDATENKQIAGLFDEQFNIKDADFMGFVKSVSNASEEILSNETFKGDDGGNVIRTTYKNGLVETIYYYPDGEFKLKTQKQDSVTETTTYVYPKQKVKPKLTDGYSVTFMNAPNAIPHTNRVEIHIDNTDMSDRAKAEAEVRDFVLSHFIDTHKSTQEALDTMGILDDIGAAINAGAGEVWNWIKDKDYQNFYELVEKFEPNYDKAILAESKLEGMRKHPVGYFTGDAAKIDTEKGLEFQQTTEQYQTVQILKTRINILNDAMREISMYESEQNALMYAPAQSEGMNPASHILNANKLLLQYFDNDQDAVDMLLQGTIGNAQATINTIRGIAQDTQKMFEAECAGKTFDEIKNDYQTKYKEIYGTDFVPDELTDKIIDAKATGGMVKLAAITIISILVTKSPIMANISAVAGGGGSPYRCNCKYDKSACYEIWSDGCTAGY